MTNEEAIKLIDDRMCFGRGKWSEHHRPVIDEYWQAGEMAIKALEQPKTGKWIPVTERLPENNDPVNVTWVNHNPEVYYMDIKDKPFTATAHYHRGHWYWYSSVTQDYLDEYGEWTPDLVDKDVEIVAWMPLPEPYKEVTT